MPARFATFIEVLRDPAVNVDTFAHVEKRAISIEKPIDATAARQRIQRFTRLRLGDVLRCFGHRAMVSEALRGGQDCSDSVVLNGAGSSNRQTTRNVKS